MAELDIVNIPEDIGKISYQRNHKIGGYYVYYDYERKYDPIKKYMIPKRILIGTALSNDKTKVKVNNTFKSMLPELLQRMLSVISEKQRKYEKMKSDLEHAIDKNNKLTIDELWSLAESYDKDLKSYLTHIKEV